MGFAQQIDFVEHNVANYVNLTVKRTHLSTVSFSRNGVIQYLAPTSSCKILLYFGSLNAVTVIPM